MVQHKATLTMADYRKLYMIKTSVY